MDFVPVNRDGFRREVGLPYDLTVDAIEAAMNDIYRLLAEINVSLTNAGLPRLEEQVRKATLSSLISDLLTAGLAKHSSTLVVNTYHNGHPDTIPAGLYDDDAVQEGNEGVEVKVSTKPSAIAFDSHAVWETWHIVFGIHVVGREEVLSGLPPETYFTSVWIAKLATEDFRKNKRNTEAGTRTASPNKSGLFKLRQGLVYNFEADFYEACGKTRRRRRVKRQTVPETAIAQ